MLRRSGPDPRTDDATEGRSGAVTIAAGRRCAAHRPRGPAAREATVRVRHRGERPARRWCWWTSSRRRSPQAESAAPSPSCCSCNSSGAVVDDDRLRRPARRASTPHRPVDVWVGPSGSPATGRPPTSSPPPSRRRRRPAAGWRSPRRSSATAPRGEAAVATKVSAGEAVDLGLGRQRRSHDRGVRLRAATHRRLPDVETSVDRRAAARSRPTHFAQLPL
jgi:hypothetical protein